MIASKLAEKVTEIIQCAMCLEVPKEPKVLPCMHHFCLSCLQEIYNSSSSNKGEIQCPSCRAVSKVPSGGLQKLSTDLRVKQIQERLAELDISNSKQTEDSSIKIDQEALNQLFQLVHQDNTSLLKSILALLPIPTRQTMVSELVDGKTVLSLACELNRLDLVKFLAVEGKADLDGKVMHIDNESTYIVTPLWLAAIFNHLEVVNILVENGASINDVSDSGSTAVRSACYDKHIEVVKYLVNNGADINIPNKYGNTCLMNARDSEEITEFLLSKGCDIDQQDNSGYTKLHYCATEDKQDNIVKLLISAGCDVNIKENDGYTPLMCAIIDKSMSIIQILLECGRCDVNAATPAGGTALHCAAEGECPLCVELLLRHGADPYLRDDNSQDAFLTAVVHGSQEVQDVLKQWHGKRIESK